MTELPGPWIEDAACVGRVTDMAMPDLHRDSSRGGKSYTRAHRIHINHARIICATCPVLDHCRDWALTVPDPALGMIAAGMTPSQRATVRALS